jgi:hypothetical protein
VQARCCLLGDRPALSIRISTLPHCLGQLSSPNASRPKTAQLFNRKHIFLPDEFCNYGCMHILDSLPYHSCAIKI